MPWKWLFNILSKIKIDKTKPKERVKNIKVGIDITEGRENGTNN